MTTTTNQASARTFALPNLLTYARIVTVPVVVACMYWQDVLQGGLWLRWVALVIFISAGVRSEERRVGKECRSRWSPYH